MEYTRKAVKIERTPIHKHTPEDYTNIGCKFTIVRTPTKIEADKIILEDEVYAPFLDYRYSDELVEFLATVSNTNLPVIIRTTSPIPKKFLEVIKNNLSTIIVSIRELPDKDFLGTLIESHDRGFNTVAMIYMDTMSEADVMQLLYYIDYTVSRIVLVSNYPSTSKYKNIKNRIPLLKTSIYSTVTMWEPKINFLGLYYRKYIKHKGIYFPEIEEWIENDKVL